MQLEAEVLDALRVKLDSLFQLPNEEWDYCKQFMRKVEVPKGEFLIRPGDPADFFAYIHQGLVKRYFTTHDGKEVIATFDAETRFISDFTALISKQPASLFIEAIEDTTLIVSELGLLNQLLKRHPVWQNILLQMTQFRYAEESNRVRELLSLNPKVLYLKFMEAYEKIYKRIPQEDVARFLGVNPTQLAIIAKLIQSE